MGVDYENIDIYNSYQYEKIIPFFFSFKKEEKNTIQKSEYMESEYSKIKDFSFSENINTLENLKVSHSRKSTLDEDEIKNDKKNNYTRKDDRIKKIFMNKNNSQFYILKKEKYNIFNEDEYYLNFNENEDIRKRYYSKLIYKNIWPTENKPKIHNSLFIFDWDDTLLPTTFLIKEGYIYEDKISEEIKDIFFILEELVLKILNLAIDKGDVYIITNSKMSWFNCTSNKYFPNLNNILNKINIISARDEYEDKYPGQNNIWKQKAFFSLDKKIVNNLIYNIICIGDSLIEIEAGKKFASQLKNSFIKTIKFNEKPEPEDLIKQLNLIVNQFNFIYSKAKNLSIIVEQKK